MRQGVRFMHTHGYIHRGRAEPLTSGMAAGADDSRPEACQHLDHAVHCQVGGPRHGGQSRLERFLHVWRVLLRHTQLPRTRVLLVAALLLSSGLVGVWLHHGRALHAAAALRRLQRKEGCCKMYAWGPPLTVIAQQADMLDCIAGLVKVQGVRSGRSTPAMNTDDAAGKRS